MARDGSGVYSAPAGTTATSGTTIESAKYNAFVNDLVTDANTPRPIVAGGTGASTASAARTALGLAIGTNVQAYDADLASWAGVTRASGFDTFAATPSSANLRSLMTDESGSGALLFAGGALGTPSSVTLTNATGLPFAGLDAAAVITSSETIASNDSDTAIPTSAAVIDYIPVAMNASGSAPMYACRCWGNLNGTGTIALRGSGNVASVTDNGTGNYTVTMTTAMPDANYCVLVSGNSGNSGAGGSINDWYSTYVISTTQFLITCYDQSGVSVDPQTICFSVFR